MEDSTIGEGKKRKKEVKIFKCPGCHTIITYEGKPEQKIIVECPTCGKKGVVVFTKEKKGNFKKSKRYSSTKKTRTRVPEKITLKKIIWLIWILLLFFTTVTILSLLFIAALGKIHLETLYVTIFIGIMILREVMDEFIPDHHKKKINVIVSGFIIIFLLLVINEIVSHITT